jgi:hypothetical protein
MDYKFPAKVGFICDKASVTFAMLRPEIKEMLYVED